TPFVYALDFLARQKGSCGVGTGTREGFFRTDVTITGDSLLLQVHPTDEFDSVINVPREQLDAVLRPLLTKREAEVATLLFQGDTIRYISTQLYISEGTVKRNLYNIYQKLAVRSQIEFIREIYIRLAQLQNVQPTE
ncbi:MAG: helix-turn-helix transcriptional regulator, partial [Oscillospiraceae bacterium]|nr:helix-turn-helix transcriptional regulator [Oscillospiraceae bacterium]